MKHQKKENVRLDIIDYSFVRVSASNKSILRPFTVFKVPGAIFSKLYKEKKWDGTVSIIKRNNLPMGLMPYFVKEATKRNIDISIYANKEPIKAKDLASNLFDPPKYDTALVKEMLNLLPPSIVPRYYQIDAFLAFMKSARGMIVLPTGAGKSLNIYMSAFMLRSIYRTGLIIVPRTSLVDQISESIRFFSSRTIDVLSTAEYGKGVLSMLNDSQNIIVSTWQSWTNWMKSGEAITPDYVLIDEAHTVALKKMPWDFMKAFAETKHRFGFTATENEMKYDKLTLQGLNGPNLYSENAEKLIDKNFLAMPFIHMIEFQHMLPDEKPTMRDLVRRPERMRYISELIPEILPEKKSLLILTESIEHEIIPLSKVLSENQDLNIYTLTGNSSRAEREKIISVIDNPDKKSVLCVTYGLFQMGINIPSLGYLMFYSPSKSHIRVLQSVGRGLRPKDICHVYDLSDYSEHRADSMSGKRRNIYRSAYGQKMKSEVINVTL